MLRTPMLAEGASTALAEPSTPTLRRSRPGDPSWPSAQAWQDLNRAVGGRMSPVTSPLATCAESPASAACLDVFKHLKNPYYIGDTPALTQTSGWLDAWTSAASAYVVAAANAQDVARTVDFAREHRLRLVVKGGGHSYQGTSNAPDSLMIWTRPMREITVHEAFVPDGCAGRLTPQPAVTVGAGALWAHVYDAVSARADRYVQGGGCLTVGVAGLVQSGGFGNFSKKFGTAAAGLLQAEVVTADGVVRIANACTHPDLFWGLKGGGGGSLGVVTRVTLRTHELPDQFGTMHATVKASSSAAFKALIGEFIAFYADNLLNEHWGETVAFHADNTLKISMLYQGLNRDDAIRIWQPFFDWIMDTVNGCTTSEPQVLAVPARRFWDATFVMQHAPGVLIADDRPGASAADVFWADNVGEAGQFLYGYSSTWLPAALLKRAQRGRLVDALFESSRQWAVSLHFNKGLAGAPADALSATRDTATNPAVLDAFALAIIAGEGPPAFPGMTGHEPDQPKARRAASRIAQAMETLRTIVPKPGAYVSESNYFESDWQQAYWGSNYARLLAVKRKYDPDGLFFVHHGVDSEEWSADGFTRMGKGAG
ncbi:FAD-binding protein [Paraburkholderia sp. IMGN_8]|uniref:FAD-dependent oxidoreductase n=1 Tax=Paraburkholderia sp. IMGN_8 TaxID=3136564 RepID=UPI003100E2CB